MRIHSNASTQKLNDDDAAMRKSNRNVDDDLFRGIFGLLILGIYKPRKKTVSYEIIKNK